VAGPQEFRAREPHCTKKALEPIDGLRLQAAKNTIALCLNAF